MRFSLGSLIAKGALLGFVVHVFMPLEASSLQVWSWPRMWKPPVVAFAGGSVKFRLTGCALFLSSLARLPPSVPCMRRGTKPWEAEEWVQEPGYNEIYLDQFVNLFPSRLLQGSR